MAAEYKDQFVVGIDVGGTGLKGSVIDRRGNVFTKEQRPTRRERGPQAVIESILGFADDLAKGSLTWANPSSFRARRYLRATIWDGPGAA